MSDARYQPIIGLELHIQLQTATKVFAHDAVAFGGDPNTQVSALTMAHPGTLPRPNQRCIEQMVRLGLAVHCEINPHSYFARKNYFYPDLPKGYQISQDQAPLCLGGYVEVPLPDGELLRVNLERIHLEEDAGKSIHDQAPDATLIDLNRAGTGLAEMVTKPDLRSAEAAGAMFAEVRRLVRYLGVSDANMERGNLRCDANVSVMPLGSQVYGTRVEIKNLNSISFLIKAIYHEVDRQIELIEAGGKVQQETRLYDVASGCTYSMRDKETAQDYRYFPEPDMLPIVVPAEQIDAIRSELPRLPSARLRDYVETVGLGVNEAFVLIEERAFSDYFEALRGLVPDPKTAANWLLGPVRSYLNDRQLDITQFTLPPQALSELIGLVEGKQVTLNAAREQLLLALIKQPLIAPLTLAHELNLMMVSDEGGLATAMEALLVRHPQEVARYHKGKRNLVGFFVGQLMREFKGKADPKQVNRIVREKLEKAR